jgi:hypothetical protein
MLVADYYSSKDLKDRVAKAVRPLSQATESSFEDYIKLHGREGRLPEGWKVDYFSEESSLTIGEVRTVVVNVENAIRRDDMDISFYGFVARGLALLGVVSSVVLVFLSK